MSSIISWRAIALTLVFGTLTIAIGIYVGMLYVGAVPFPKVGPVAQSVIPFFRGEKVTIISMAILVLAACAAAAPLLFAFRSTDILAVIVSLALTIITVALFMIGQTAMHIILAALIYVANTALSAIVFAAHRIEKIVARATREEDAA